MIILDILTAIAMATLIAAASGRIVSPARETFMSTVDRNELIRDYDSGLGSRTVYPFGNDGFEDISRVVSPTGKDIEFSSVRSGTRTDVQIDAREIAGTPYCSPDLTASDPVGSYAYFARRKNDPESLGMPEVTIRPITLPIDPLLPLTDLEVRNGIAYVSADSAVSADPDLMVFRIGAGNDPVLVSSLNSGPGISSFVLHGRKIFAAAASTAFQLHTANIGPNLELSLKDRFKLPLPYATATAPFASSIFYDNGLVYLGTERWDGDEFNIIRVSDSDLPQKIGGYETGSKINDIFVREGVSLLADSDAEQFRALDVRDPASVVPLSSLEPSGWERQEGRIINLFEGATLAGRTSGGFNITTDHELFAWASGSPSFFVNGHSIDSSGGIYGLVADRYRTYAASSETDREFRIMDRNLATSTAHYYPLPVAPQVLTCDNDRLYVLARTAPVIYEISFR